MQKIKHAVVLLCLFLMPHLALAANTPDNLEPLEEVPPPPKVVDGEALEGEPQVTIRKKGKDTIEEYRINGELYMMKVTPEHGVPYYLHKEDQDGSWVNSGPNKPMSIPKWIIFRF
jgi:hypothetical protein